MGHSDTVVMLASELMSGIQNSLGSISRTYRSASTQKRVNVHGLHPTADGCKVSNRSSGLTMGLAELDGWLLKQQLLEQDAPEHLWDHASDCFAILDGNGQVVWLNKAGQALWRVSHQGATAGPETVASGPFANLWHGSSRDAVMAAIEMARTGQEASVQGTISSATGKHSIWEARISSAGGGEPGCPWLLVVARDVTKRMRRQASLDRAANHDAMTGLLNRAAFVQHVSICLLQRQRLTLVLLDVDHLKRANDTDGHAAGNTLIRHFAGRLAALQTNQVAAARLGGDEFALACLGDIDQTELEKTLAALCRPVQLKQLTWPYSASAGTASDATAGVSFDDLHLCADLALYACKALGGGRLQVFDATMRDRLQKKACIVRLTKRAITGEDIVPYYQPKIDIGTGEVVGFEALLRVRFPDGSMQTATAVAAALREPDLASQIDRAMLQRVLADIRLWKKDGIIVPIAINLSDGEVREKGFADRFLMTLSAGGVEPRQIEVEITESVLLDNADSPVEQTLQALSAAGVRIALDDFGTGYASLSHLKRFPIDTIKIDRQFVQNLTADSDDLAIVRAMVGLGRSLAVEVVAEGIEQRAQLDLLRAEGCRTGQGFLFSPAVPQAEAHALAKRSARALPGAGW